MINNILPKIQANVAGAADAIMLDAEGFVAETNATNLFMVDERGVLATPHPDYCLPGITRETVLEMAKELGIPAEERRISLFEFHAASEVFTTGTMGELTPVCEVGALEYATTTKTTQRASFSQSPASSFTLTPFSPSLPHSFNSRSTGGALAQVRARGR